MTTTKPPMDTFVVVDANVVGAASRSPAPTAFQARAAHASLMAIAESSPSLGVFLSQRLLKEWWKLQQDTGKPRISHESQRWLANMRLHRRVKENPEPLPLRDLRDAVQALPSEPERDAAEKDRHLVEAALAESKRIVSFDDRARGLYATIAKSHTRCASIHWANPRHERCLPWLRGGAPDDVAFLLTSAPA